MKKLLIIEDEPVLLKMYVNKFQSGNFEVLTAGDGEAGIEAAIKNQPDFIILDLRLPKTDGLQVLQRLKEIPNIQDIPVAILTVVQEELALKKDPDLISKAVAYWRKDEITPAELYENVEKYLNDHA